MVIAGVNYCRGVERQAFLNRKYVGWVGKLYNDNGVESRCGGVV